MNENVRRDESARRRALDLVEEELEAALDAGAVDAITPSRIHEQTSGGRAGDAFLSDAEEAALDHGSVDRMSGRPSRSGETERTLVLQEEEAALDHGSVDRIATRRPPAPSTSRGGSAGRRGS